MTLLQGLYRFEKAFGPTSGLESTVPDRDWVKVSYVSWDTQVLIRKRYMKLLNWIGEALSFKEAYYTSLP